MALLFCFLLGVAMETVGEALLLGLHLAGPADLQLLSWWQRCILGNGVSVQNPAQGVGWLGAVGSHWTTLLTRARHNLQFFRSSSSSIMSTNVLLKISITNTFTTSHSLLQIVTSGVL